MSEQQVEECREVARQFLGYSRAFFPFFVLHDFTHSENICHNLLELPGLFGGITSYELKLLYMAAYLHDIGMALPPSVIDELNICVKNVLEDVRPESREKLLRKIECFQSFIENGYVRLKKGLKKGETSNELACSDRTLSALECSARLVRLLHPWISSSFIRNHLKKELGLEVPVEVERLCRYHNSKTPIPSRDQRLRKLTIALRLADAMDFSWMRGKYFFKIAWKQYLPETKDQLKHWAFKLSVKEVRVREGSLRVEISEGADKASVFGVLFFEISKNFYEDWQEVVDCGLQVPIKVCKGRAKVDVTGFVGALNRAYDRIAEEGFDIISNELETVGTEDLRSILEMLRDLHKKWIEEKRRNRECALEVSAFDALALAVAARVNVDDVVDTILRKYVDATLRERIECLL